MVNAFGNLVRERSPSAKIRYLHAEQYVSDLVRAVQHRSFDQFKRYYQSLDLLLIDDIQFFADKDRTQEEFFYTFNALLESRRQIVITCDSFPKEIAGMEDRLKTRFGWGLTVAVEPPDLEMRGGEGSCGEERPWWWCCACVRRGLEWRAGEARVSTVWGCGGACRVAGG